MKAKYYIGILSALLLSGMPVKAQYSDDFYPYNDGARIIVNNYDLNYSSRISRFHGSYATFEYYSPVFTSAYWYGYTPFSWGVNIDNGGFGFSLGYNFYYPVYYGNTYYYDYDWYEPFYYSHNYWDYTPYYHNAFTESGRQIADVIRVQGSGMRRSATERPEASARLNASTRPDVSSRPGYYNPVRSNMNYQPENRRNISPQFEAKTSAVAENRSPAQNRSMSTPSEIYSPSRRESNISNSNSSPQKELKPSAAETSRPENNGRRK